MSGELEIPPMDLPEEALQERFDRLKQKLLPLWRSIEKLNQDEQTIVVVPSLTVQIRLDAALRQAYEERFLFLLLLLRQPRARVVYVTSQAILPTIVEYYLGLLPGIITTHARERLFLVSPEDGSAEPLVVKLLKRPHLIERIRSLVKDPDRAHLVPFTTTRYERDLALRLGIPLYGADPRHLGFGTKSGCRKLFAAAGITHPFGFEDRRSLADLVEAVREIRVQRPECRQAMVKLNEGVSGDGNAVADLSGLDPRDERGIETRVRGMRFELEGLTLEAYLEKLAEAGGIVEERITGEVVRSPSVQLRITPLGAVEVLSTHDQLLGGPSGQIYLGCRFPADPGYAALISREARKAGGLLAEAGVLGRFAIDFITARQGDAWTAHAIELNLRKGGTTHPFLTLQFLTDGTYDAERALFITPAGASKCFVANDHVESPAYRAFSPEQLFDIAVRHGLHFNQTLQKGVVFHMLAALGARGRLGLTAVAGSHEEADAIYQRTLEVLEVEAREALRPRELPPG
jgi:hypothetical protein